MNDVGCFQEGNNDITRPFNDFESACRHVLTYLKDRICFEQWLITRLEDQELVVLQAENDGHGMSLGDTIPWDDSTSPYIESPVYKSMDFGAYIGFPITFADGHLFGMLCAIDSRPQSESIKYERPLIELLVNMLNGMLDADTRIMDQAKDLERFQYHAYTDPLTGLLNRRGWEQAIKKEEVRAKRYGSCISVFILDLDNLKPINDTKGHAEGDSLLRCTAKCLTNILRENDILARIGGDEFAILAIGCNRDGAERMLCNIQQVLNVHDVQASIGVADFNPETSLDETINIADMAMYRNKQRKRMLESRIGCIIN